MAAYGSGAVARSIRNGAVVMNIDIGGGTAKIAVCRAGAVIGATALDVGARLVTVDADGRLTRIEEAARYFAKSIGWSPVIGTHVPPEILRSLASVLARALFDAIERRADPKLLRLDPLQYSGPVDAVVVSGGVSEFLYGRETGHFGDLGQLLAQEVRQGILQRGWQLQEPTEGIRATVVGASQYTTQLSGSTIYVAPDDALPVRNVPVVPIPPLEDVEELDVAALKESIRAALVRMELDQGERPVALAFKWEGAATFARLDGFCRALVAGLESVLRHGHPLIVVGDDDVGGLIGIHLKHELQVPNAVISVDGLELKSFDYIDIGALLPESGAVPVIIKSLVFPSGEALGLRHRTMLE
jgi:ethanolamine utilization protein EutA